MVEHRQDSGTNISLELKLEPHSLKLSYKIKWEILKTEITD